MPRSGAVLTCHRHVIHSRAPSSPTLIPSKTKERAGICLLVLLWYRWWDLSLGTTTQKPRIDADFCYVPRSGAVLTCHRHVIHSRAPSSPTSNTANDKKADRLKPIRSFVVPVVGLEPTRCCHRQILSLVRLPIPSHRRHRPVYYIKLRLQCQDVFKKYLVFIRAFYNFNARQK